MIPLFSLIAIWFGIGIILGVINELSKKVAFIIWIIAVIVLTLSAIIFPQEFALNWNPWWHYLIGFVFVIIGNVLGKFAVENIMRER